MSVANGRASASRSHAHAAKPPVLSPGQSKSSEADADPRERLHAVACHSDQPNAGPFDLTQHRLQRRTVALRRLHGCAVSGGHVRPRKPRQTAAAPIGRQRRLARCV